MKILTAVLLFLALVACVQKPTQSTEVVDDRPRLAFDAAALPSRPNQYEVVVDGISYGSMEQFLVNQNALRVIDGPHRVEVYKRGNLVFHQDVVLGANTTRVIKVVEHE